MPKKKKNKTHWRFEQPSGATQEKYYYSIGEVARLYNVDEVQLRYWERHTPLAPKRTLSGARQYTKEDLALVAKIRYLLLDKGLSLQAVSEKLKNSSPIETDLMIREKLLETREKVAYLRELVNKQLDGSNGDKE